MPQRFCTVFILTILLTTSFFSDAGYAEEKKKPDLYILYTADLHGHLDGDSETIGIDKIASARKSLPHALLLDAGDFLHGTPLAVLNQGQDVIQLMKLSNYFSATAGNHEFDYGQETLKQRAAEALSEPNKLYILSANITDQAGKPLLLPFAVTIVNNIKVCVFGLTTPQTRSQTLSSSTSGLIFADPVETAHTMVAKLQSMDCGLIVALTHLGSHKNTAISSRELGRKVAGIDVIIDGHSHMLLEETTEQGGLLLGAGEHGKILGILSLFFDPDKRCLIRKHNRFLNRFDMEAYPSDNLVRATLTGILEKQKVLLKDVIGYAVRDLLADKTTLRTRESEVGNLCADSLRYAANTEIAIINGGGIRADLHQGVINRGDLLAVLPFQDTVFSLEINGAELLRMLEHGFASLPDASGAFPQISGMVIRLNPEAPAGKRIRTVLINGQPLAKERKYTLAINGFLLQGGDEYSILLQKVQARPHGSTLTALENLIRKKKIIAIPGKSPTRIFFDFEHSKIE